MAVVLICSESAFLSQRLDAPVSLHSLELRAGAMVRDSAGLSPAVAELAAVSVDGYVRDGMSGARLKYINPSVEIELLSVEETPPSQYVLSARSSIDGSDLFATFIRTASMEIDLTGATGVQGFDPDQPLVTASADEFVGRFTVDESGEYVLSELH